MHYVLKESQDPSGSGISSKRKRTENPWYLNIAYVKVDKQYKRQGLASLLLQAVPRHLAKTATSVKKFGTVGGFPTEDFEVFAKRMVLSVAHANSGAIRLYEKMGFKVDKDGPTMSTVGNTEVEISWCRMERDAEPMETLDSIARKWGDIAAKIKS